VEQLRATFAAAAEFGLNDEEIWQVVLEVCDGVPPDAPAEDSLDELAGALANELLRREPTGRRPDEVVLRATEPRTLPNQ
jgi:hypothetical protein